MSSLMPKISIVMPVLNRIATIEKAIQSLVAQHYQNLEFIIIDGGSTDGTVEIIEKYAEHISYWHSKPDGSPSVAANMGVAMATGDLIALFMADDWYEPEVLHSVACAFRANPHGDIFSCAGRIVEFDAKTETYESQWTYDNENALRLNFYNVCFAVSAICCRFIRKSLYDQLGPYLTANGKGKHMLCNDKEFLLRAIMHGVNDVFVPVMGHTYLASKASSTFGQHKNNIRSMCHDHIYIAETYLQRKDLSLKQRLILHHWYADNATRVVLYSLLDKNFRMLFSATANGMRKYPLVWPFAIMFNTLKISAKRCIKKLFPV
jgi:glycosyltransferase involved in cell wall biosynthesis